MTQRSNEPADGVMTFWEHLDVLRSSIIKMLAVTGIAAVVAFVFKDAMFDLVLAPTHSDFITYRLIGAPPMTIHLVNIGLTEQFMIHLKTACFFGIVIASPFILFLLYQFVRPALYDNEAHDTALVVGAGYLMFVVGLIVNYFVVFPLTVRFLGTYSVSSDVGNMLSLQSYMDTLLMLSLVFGIVFELPVVSGIMAKLGLLKAEWMTRYRRHAIVVILVVAAIVTPTSDVFTLVVVSLPIWLLYEVSIIITKHTETLC